MKKQAMTKTAAMNKLAQAVSNYVKAEAQFNKIASAIGQFDSGRYQAPQANLQKEAQGILQRLGLTAPPPAAKSNMGRNAALAALLLGGGAAGAHAAGLFGGDEGAAPSPGKKRMDMNTALRKSDAAPFQTGNNVLDSLLGEGSGVGGATAGLNELYERFGSKVRGAADLVPDSFQFQGLDEDVIQSLRNTIMSGAPLGPRAHY